MLISPNGGKKELSFVLVKNNSSIKVKLIKDMEFGGKIQLLIYLFA
jgi:hypothetical protein